MTQPVFVAGVNVFAVPIQFQEYSEPSGVRGGMGNEKWADVDNPLYDPDNTQGLGPKDFPG